MEGNGMDFLGLVWYGPGPGPGPGPVGMACTYLQFQTCR